MMWKWSFARSCTHEQQRDVKHSQPSDLQHHKHSDRDAVWQQRWLNIKHPHKKLDIHVMLAVFVTLYSPAWTHMQTNTAVSPQPQYRISPDSLWQSPWLVPHSAHNEHICLLAGKALILCNVTWCQLREGLLWKMPACCCCCCGTAANYSWWMWRGESSDSW